MDERDRLLGILQELTNEELRLFAFYLPRDIPGGRRDTTSRVDLAEVVLRYYPEEALDVTAKVLNKMRRRDLALELEGQLRGAGPRAQRTEEEIEVAAAGEQKGDAAAVAGLADGGPQRPKHHPSWLHKNS
ncbi:uncharacterized protein LOC134490666 isoform X2 [Candoia aspera]|uniref:uncharacterized protein LOC134490666 isoform X2 n=1 Tax=Candoia aspera TaxID=51853 RepID=UPI002FD7C5F5